jgi:SAM-dependent methyltransferase
MSRELARPGRTVVGIDLSPAELALAAERGPGPWVRGDALKLPIRDGAVDVVTSSMGLVVVRPLEGLLTEITRVLRPGGVLAAIAPAVRPLGPLDLRTLGQLSRRLRTRPRFPGPVELAGFHKALDAVGLTRVEDKRERYSFPVRNREDAELVMSALYLPGTRRSRVEAAVEYLEDRLERAESVEVAIPMRRVVAIK